MVMDTLQIRLTHELVETIDRLVKKGLYSSRSDAIRDCVRRLHLQEQIGSIPNTGDSVKEIRAIRKKLSQEEDMDIDALNKL